ncbi:conserved protein of unknown function [Legionella hackeliae]|uniref:Inner membrane protein YgaP-like transmembrane domain-containing protein n=2 Tax=Legionella hackeliae TaxID=449 RepID=A0A0A8USU0_LEGHA|nr:conserved protein of unknown function [Legionella hackeliae]
MYNREGKMKFACNIDKTDRINRTIIGAALCIAALFGMGKYFYIVLGLALIIEGIIGWCSIPYTLSKIKRLFQKRN